MLSDGNIRTKFFLSLPDTMHCIDSEPSFLQASSSSLFMPEPEDAVAHGDANLAVNDFLTRTV